MRKRYGPDRNSIKCLVEDDQNHEDKMWLRLELFVELLDRQCDSFVGTNYLQSAEVTMIQNNTDMMEAFWWRLICQWYQPVDGVRLSVSQLVEWMMELHNHLSQFCRPSSLKTPSVPFIRHPYAQLKCIVAMLLGRLQLYPLAESGTCEQRSISSLNSEAMFGKFQDLDQNGFSVLRADDIPPASMTMVCIFTYTLNPQGVFAMDTCQNHLVEPFHKVTKKNHYISLQRRFKWRPD